MNVTQAILSLEPNAQFAITNGDYSTIERRDSRTKPTKGEVDAEVSRLIDAEPMRLLRVERDRLLAETDWVSAKSIDTGVGISTDWKTYRQTLRDLPSSASPVYDLTVQCGVSSVTWPTKPS